MASPAPPLKSLRRKHAGFRDNLLRSFATCLSWIRGVFETGVRCTAAHGSSECGIFGLKKIINQVQADGAAQHSFKKTSHGVFRRCYYYLYHSNMRVDGLSQFCHAGVFSRVGKQVLLAQKQKEVHVCILNRCLIKRNYCGAAAQRNEASYFFDRQFCFCESYSNLVSINFVCLG